MGKRSIVVLLVPVLTATTALSVFASSAFQGDTNNDSRIDVLDVQTLAADLFFQESADFQDDVNSDGEINVLDLQRLMASVLGHESRPIQPRSESKSPSGTLVEQTQLKIDTATVVLAKVEQTDLPRLACQPADLEVENVPKPRIALFLYKLTYHAPPHRVS